MENNQKNYHETEVSIDLVHLAKSLWKRAWAILLITLLMGGAAFGFTKLFIKEKYESYVDFYVNNGTLNNSFNISGLEAGRDLVDTYLVILDSRQTMLDIKETADVKESWQQISGMITSGARNGTEIFRVKVTGDSSEKTHKIAWAIKERFPKIIEDTMDGHTVKVVDYDFEEENLAKKTAPVSPNAVKNTVIGMVIGFIMACILFAVLALIDDTIHDDDSITDNYDLPILSKIPNLGVQGKSENSKYKRYYYYSASAKHGDAADNE